MFERIKKFIKFIYLKIVQINDTPHKISLGLAIGVILGVIPGTGPLAAFIISFLLKANPMAAILGSLCVNTWFSVVILIPAIKITSFIFKLNWQQIYAEGMKVLPYFRWQDILKLSIYRILLPILVGYAIIAVGLGLIVYIVSMVVLKRQQKWKLG